MGNLSTPKSVQKLQTALHAKAKAEAGFRFYAQYDKIYREDILAHAYAQCRSNMGAAGVNGSSGLSSLVSQTQFLEGNAECQAGGVRIDSGLYLDTDGVLGSNEITGASFVCEFSSGSLFH